MRSQLLTLQKQALARIQQAKDLTQLDQLRIHYLGRKGQLNTLLKKLPQLSPSQRKSLGRLANQVKNQITAALQKRQQQLAAKADRSQFFDFSLPPKLPPQGHLHLVTQAIQEISHIFERIGFVRVRYPEVEWDWYAFEGLNMPKGHPARDEWETFFVDAPESKKYGKMVLTPHTSSGQLREMQRRRPPIRMINIAKCYRRQVDVTHTPMFHQFEGLVIDKDISIVHLKGTLDYFAQSFFGPGRRTRLRPFHFRFTEPSFEIDINCPLCLGKGCKTCKSGWHELGGAGMVHPNVLKAGGLDPQKYSGFAFGFGVERTFMMKSGIKIDDIRVLYSNDIRFLEQF